MRTPLLALTLALLALPAAAGELREQVLTHLGGIEEVPTAEALRALGPSVADELAAIAEDSTLPRSQRARALTALGWFPSDATRALLVAAIDGGDELFARKAVYALGTGWGEAALPELERALAHDDVQRRIAAARALGGIGTDGARAALDRRLPVESEPAVRSTIEHAIGR